MFLFDIQLNSLPLASKSAAQSPLHIRRFSAWLGIFVLGFSAYVYLLCSLCSLCSLCLAAQPSLSWWLLRSSLSFIGGGTVAVPNRADSTLKIQSKHSGRAMRLGVANGHNDATLTLACATWPLAARLTFTILPTATAMCALALVRWGCASIKRLAAANGNRSIRRTKSCPHWIIFLVTMAGRCWLSGPKGPMESGILA
jgi:hypothetical protein